MKTHTVTVQDLTFQVTQIDEVPKHLLGDYSKYYEVRLFGDVVFYLAKGHRYAPKEIIGWYAHNEVFHPGFGTTFKEIITLLATDAVKHLVR